MGGHRHKQRRSGHKEGRVGHRGKVQRDEEGSEMEGQEDTPRAKPKQLFRAKGQEMAACPEQGYERHHQGRVY